MNNNFKFYELSFENNNEKKAIIGTQQPSLQEAAELIENSEILGEDEIFKSEKVISVEEVNFEQAQKNGIMVPVFSSDGQSRFIENLHYLFKQAPEWKLSKFIEYFYLDQEERPQNDIDLMIDYFLNDPERIIEHLEEYSDDIISPYSIHKSTETGIINKGLTEDFTYDTLIEIAKNATIKTENAIKKINEQIPIPEVFKRFEETDKEKNTEYIAEDIYISHLGNCCASMFKEDLCKKIDFGQDVKIKTGQQMSDLYCSGYKPVCSVALREDIDITLEIKDNSACFKTVLHQDYTIQTPDGKFEGTEPMAKEIMPSENFPFDLNKTVSGNADYIVGLFEAYVQQNLEPTKNYIRQHEIIPAEKRIRTESEIPF